MRQRYYNQDQGTNRITRLGEVMLNLSIPEHIVPLRSKVLNFVEQEVYPVEKELTEDKISQWFPDQGGGHQPGKNRRVVWLVMPGLIASGFNLSGVPAHSQSSPHNLPSPLLR